MSSKNRYGIQDDDWLSLFDNLLEKTCPNIDWHSKGIENEQQEQPIQETSSHAPQSRLLGADHRCG